MNITRNSPVWLFDLDNTLHNASHAIAGLTEMIRAERGLRQLMRRLPGRKSC